MSYNVPPYGRSGLYLELASLKDLVEDYRSTMSSGGDNKDMSQTIFDSALRSGMVSDVPLTNAAGNDVTLVEGTDLPDDVLDDGVVDAWVLRLSDYLNVVQDRLFSSGLR